MFSDEANEEIQKALLQFLNHPDVTASHLLTPEERKAVFTDKEVQSSAGNLYGDYFGWWD